MLGKITKIQYKKSKPKNSYAFITDFNGVEYYFPLDGVTGFNVDDLVSFTGEQNEKGYIATNVSMYY